MTKEEAKTKWCPMTRPLKRDDEPEKCIADGAKSQANFEPGIA